jgi:chemotaxis protein MotB
MKIPVQTILLIAILGSLTLSSCVSKKKYLAATAWNGLLQRDSSLTHSQLNACNDQIRNLVHQRNGLKWQNLESQEDLKKLALSSKLTIAEQEKRLDTMWGLFQKQKRAMNDLKKVISDALENFNADELSVYKKDGKVYVSLYEKLLFESGSAKVDLKGKEALSTLAKVLNTTSNISVTIEGHTDSIPIKNADFSDNWALSTGRAISIVRTLTKEYGVNPKSIIAAGRSEFHPIKSNTTNEGRASNRRTEIIIAPRLNELYKLLEN